MSLRRFIDGTRPWVLLRDQDGKPGLVWRPRSFKQKAFKRFVEGLICLLGANLVLLVVWLFSVVLLQIGSL